MLLETLVKNFILDVREPGSFNPIAGMRRKLSDNIVKSRFHILELERHRARVRPLTRHRRGADQDNRTGV